MWHFSEREKLPPKAPLINKDYKKIDLDINIHFM